MFSRELTQTIKAQFGSAALTDNELACPQQRNETQYQPND